MVVNVYYLLTLLSPRKSSISRRRNTNEWMALETPSLTLRDVYGTFCPRQSTVKTSTL